MMWLDSCFPVNDFFALTYSRLLQLIAQSAVALRPPLSFGVMPITRNNLNFLCNIFAKL